MQLTRGTWRRRQPRPLRTDPCTKRARLSFLNLLLAGLASCVSERADVTPTELRLTQTGDFPCELVIVPTGVRLKGDGRDVPDPHRVNVRDTRGFFYTGTFTRDQYAVWSSRGEHIRTVGRRGSGPGEFTQIMSIFLDPADTVHVRDRNGWSVLDSSGHFVRRLSNQNLALVPEHIRFVGAREILVSGSLRRPEAFYFHIVDTDGGRVRSFGPVQPEDQARVAGGLYERATTWDGDSTIWAAAARGSLDGYTAEQWTLSGSNVRRILRETSWFPDPGNEQDINVLPVADYVHVDSSGLVLVYLGIPTPRLQRDAPPNADRSGWWEGRYEVIEPGGGQVLASGTLPYVDRPFFYPLSRVGYRAVNEPSGDVVHEIVEFRLRAASGRRGGDGACSKTQRPSP